MDNISSNHVVIAGVVIVVVVVILLVVFFLQSSSQEKKNRRQLSVEPFDVTKDVQDEFLVLMQPKVSEQQFKKHLNEMQALLAQNSQRGLDPNGRILTAWSIRPSFKAYHVRSERPDAWLPYLREKAADKVARVERNGYRRMMVTRPCNVQQNAPWQLQRIQSHHPYMMDGLYTWDFDGQGVDAYVVDTGINKDHIEFGGRVVLGADFTDDPMETDGNGHGTHVAGLLGGRNVGVARGVTIIAVKVLNCKGVGTKDAVLSGMAWVSQSVRQRDNRRAVVNMSLGGPKSAIENEAVAALVQNGIVVVAAAGNENSNAANVSPASASTAIAVGATGPTNHRAPFSNWGPQVALFAPGEDLRSADEADNESYEIYSGTSQASPIVSGAVALLLQQFPDKTPKQIRTLLLEQASKDLVKLDCSGTCGKTSNRLLYVAPCARD